MKTKEIENRIDSLVRTLKKLEENKSKILSILDAAGMDDKLKSAAIRGIGLSIHNTNHEIRVCKKKLGLPTQSQIKRRKKAICALMNTLPDEIKNAMWETRGKDGNDRPKVIKLIDCGDEHLSDILTKLPSDHQYAQFIHIILEERKKLSKHNTKNK